MTTPILFTTHLFCCFAMTGLIWLIQLVHYPSFKFIEEKSFKNFNIFHQNRISFIVIPLMLVELGSAALLTFYHWNGILIINLLLNIFIFLSTFFLSVPLHKKLLQSKVTSVIDKLIFTNWPRTLFWSFRSVLLFIVLLNSIQQVVFPW